MVIKQKNRSTADHTATFSNKEKPERQPGKKNKAQRLPQHKHSQGVSNKHHTSLPWRRQTYDIISGDALHIQVVAAVATPTTQPSLLHFGPLKYCTGSFIELVAVLSPSPLLLSLLPPPSFSDSSSPTLQQQRARRVGDPRSVECFSRRNAENAQDCCLSTHAAHLITDNEFVPRLPGLIGTLQLLVDVYCRL